MKSYIPTLTLFVAAVMLASTATAQNAVRALPLQRDFVVASPRAAIAPAPGTQGDRCCCAVGAAYNFARPDARVVVRRGSVVFFRLGRNMEGVWYEDACGQLGTLLQLDLAVSSTDPANTRWIPVGRDGARAERCGPSLGSADVKVPFRFWRPGEFLLRARVSTWARPGCPDAGAVVPCADRTYDEIYIKVRVVDRVSPGDASWEEIPLEGDALFREPLTRSVDPEPSDD